MPVRSRSRPWRSAIQPTAPSRTARSSSSDLEYPTRTTPPSPSEAGASGSMAASIRSATSAKGSSRACRAASGALSGSPRASATVGIRRSEPASAKRSRGVARPAPAFAASRSRSEIPFKASRSRRRRLTSWYSSSTASKRRRMASSSPSGRSTHPRSNRAPIGVSVRSMTESRVAPPSGCIGRTTSRFRRVISSRCKTEAARSARGGRNEPSAPGCISSM